MGGYWKCVCECVSVGGGWAWLGGVGRRSVVSSVCTFGACVPSTVRIWLHRGQACASVGSVCFLQEGLACSRQAYSKVRRGVVSGNIQARGAPAAKSEYDLEYACLERTPSRSTPLGRPARSARGSARRREACRSSALRVVACTAQRLLWNKRLQPGRMAVPRGGEV